MKILIVGGGPGGLYAGLLLKKAQPAYDIEIVERNPAGATYGWGVVFSDRTLDAFREADARSYQQITDSFVIWTAIDILYRDQVIRCDGHRFAGMARRRLLQILQSRCRELGVKLVFDREVTDFSAFGDYDLVLAADGVNSFIRTAYKEQFQPKVTEGEAKFIWFGTDKVLDAFTFIFKENEHGLFQVHAYPFDGETSTFIVECAEDVWRRAGLDQADEAASIAYCHELFADFLGSHNLLSNRSLWLNFNEVRNRVWRHGNIVLLGDSAHTAHFSIGSGTKLAMDGAIALANAFAQTEDVDKALRLYQMERGPRVASLQEAAVESQQYFENIKRYLHLEPMQFAFHLLTRSGRIHYDNLRVRDPYYMDGVDRWYKGGSAPPLIAPPPLFMPLPLRRVTFANRIAVESVLNGAVDGLPDAATAAQLARVAECGAALVLPAPVAVSPAGRISTTDAGLYNDAAQAAWTEAAAAVHDAGGHLGLTLNHAGRRGSTLPRQHGLDLPLPHGWPISAPSALPYGPGAQKPLALSVADLEGLTGDFVNAAARAATSGVDLLLLHAGHGYLLGSFLSPLANLRTDEYGGELADRLRFPLAVAAAVRAVWPLERPLGVVLNATDWARGGTTIDDAVATAIAFRGAGVDLVQVVAGQTVADDRPVYGSGFLTHFSDQIRHEAGVATLVGGYLTSTGEINSILAAGRADLCILSERW